MGQPDRTSNETQVEFKHSDLISSVHIIQGTETEEKPSDTVRKQVRQIQKGGHSIGKTATFLQSLSLSFPIGKMGTATELIHYCIVIKDKN